MGQEQKDPLKEYKIYMSIDHLKKGVYSLKISPSFIYYLPKDQVDVKINWFEINGNANYYFLDQDKLSVYGLGGLNYSSVKAKYDGPYSGLIDYGASDGRFGLNIGGGANFILGNLMPFAELKYVIIDGGATGAGRRGEI